MQPLPAGLPPSPQITCTWPALLELHLDDLFVSSVREGARGALCHHTALTGEGEF
jgi:hypothetical protein